MATGVEQQNLDSRTAMIKDLNRRRQLVINNLREYIAGLIAPNPLPSEVLSWVEMDAEIQNEQALLTTEEELIPDPPAPPTPDPNGPPPPP